MVRYVFVKSERCIHKIRLKSRETQLKIGLLMRKNEMTTNVYVLKSVKNKISYNPFTVLMGFTPNKLIICTPPRP